MDVQHNMHGRSSVSLWTYGMTSVDVHQFFHARITCDRGYMYNRTSMDVHQVLYEPTNCGHGLPPVTISTYNIT